MKHIQKLVGGAIALATLLMLSPVLAQELVPTLISADISIGAESVVADPSDPPLERNAKLHRAWTLYREKGSSQIWTINKSEQTKHEIQTLDFFTAFDANYHVLLVGGERLARFTVGDPITSAEGLNPDDWRKRPFECRLVKTADRPAVYLVCHTKKRVIIREGVFHRYGWEFRDVEVITQDELDSFETDLEVDEETVFDEGVEVETTKNRKLREQVGKRLDLKGKKTVRERAIKQHGRPDVFVTTPDGKLRHIKSIKEAEEHGINLDDLTEVSENEVEAFEVETEEEEVEGIFFERLLNAYIL